MTHYCKIRLETILALVVSINFFLWPFFTKVNEYHLNLNVVINFFLFFIIFKLSFKKNIFIFFFLFFLSLLFAMAISPCQANLKFYASFLIFLYSSLIAFKLSNYINVESFAKLASCTFFFLIFTLLSVFLEIFGIIFPFKQEYLKSLNAVSGYSFFGGYSGYFLEPSHLAYSTLPTTIFLLFSPLRKYRIFSYIYILIVTVFTKSTLAMFFALILIFLFFREKISLRKMLVSVTILVMLVFFALSTDKFINKFDIYNNLSTLAFINGYQYIAESLISTNFLGVGFNMLGCIDFNTVYDELIYDVSGKMLNKTDGSFFFSKFISENGILAIIIIFLILIYIFKNFSLNSMDKINSTKRIISSLLIIFIFISSTRSLGYFTMLGYLPFIIYAIKSK